MEKILEEKQCLAVQNSINAIEKENKEYLDKNPLSEILLPPIQPPVNKKYRSTILAAEKKLLCDSRSVTAEDFPLRHSFADGVYIRELFVPKGFIVISKIHPAVYTSFFIHGDITMYTEKGLEKLSAPKTIISPAWTKRIFYTHTDFLWATVHPNESNSRNIEELESVIHKYEYGDVYVDASKEENNYILQELTEEIQEIEKDTEEK